jgi:lysophospholipase L1-like esterase
VTINQRLLATIAIVLWGAVPNRIAGERLARLRNSLKNNMMNRADLERIEQGYYERLVESGPRLDNLVDPRGLLHRLQAGTTWSVPVDAAPLVMRVDDLREVILKGNDAVEKREVCWRTNAEGMRDESYAAAKPAGTIRIALVGDSIAAGWGVNAEARFESILERSWNERFSHTRRAAVEILNCAVPGQSPGQRWYHFNQIGWPMHPDLVICESTAADVGWDERRLRYLMARGLAWNSPIFRQALLAAAVEPLWNPDRYRQALRPRHVEILAGIYQTMAADCRAHGVPLLLVLIPRVGRPNDLEDQQVVLQTARAAGLRRVIDVTDAYDGIDPARLAVAPSDFHPNAAGHARLARRLDAALRDLPELRDLWEPPLDRPPGLDREPPQNLSAAAPPAAHTVPGPHSRQGVRRQ